YSWRVSILPFIEQNQIHDQFDREASWDSPQNKIIADTDIYLFHCPSCENSPPCTTNYVLVTGPGTAWDGDKVHTLDDLSYPEQTLILIEVADTDIHWAEPRDLKIDDIDPRFLDEEGNFKCNHPGFVIGAFADGHVEKIPQDQIMEALQKWSQVEQEKREREE
ncbi:MAG: DUF1559 domain-containing protein, partial [Planctomycetia bacterium]